MSQLKISGFHVSNLSNDALFEQQTQFGKTVEKFPAVKQKIAAQFEVWKAAHQKVDDSMKKMPKSLLTQKIVDTDRERRETYSGMVEVNSGSTRHFDPQVRYCANNLTALFKTYGNVARKPRNEQTAAVHNLLQDLTAKFAPDVKKVGLDGWVKHLSALNDRIRAQKTERFDERAAKSTINLKAARKELEEAYRTICTIINAFVLVDGVATYEQFIVTLNVINAKYGGKSVKRNIGANIEGANAVASEIRRGSAVVNKDDFDCIIIPPPAGNDEIKQWSAGEDFNKMKLGDLRQTADGRVWELINLGQAHRDPTGEFGHFGWKLV